MSVDYRWKWLQVLFGLEVLWGRGHGMLAVLHVADGERPCKSDQELSSDRPRVVITKVHENKRLEQRYLLFPGIKVNR